jgi:hypothetical protein
MYVTFFFFFFFFRSNAREEVLLSSFRDAKVTSFGSNNNSSVLSVSSSLPRLGPVLSANTRLSQSEWQEAVANFLAKSDDLTLCPGSELLSPAEKQVSETIILIIIFKVLSNKCFPLNLRFAKIYV